MLALKTMTTEELRWDYGGFANVKNAAGAEVLRGLADELKLRGAALDGPARRQGGPVADRFPYVGVVHNGRLAVYR